MKLIHKDLFTIYYDNTDSSGFTYHTSYLSLAERARSNLLTRHIPDVMSMMKNNSFFFVIKKVNLNFIKPTYLFDELVIETYYRGNSYTSINLFQKFIKKDLLICELNICLVWINGKTKKPSKIPSDIISRFKSLEVV